MTHVNEFSKAPPSHGSQDTREIEDGQRGIIPEAAIFFHAEQRLTRRQHKGFHDRVVFAKERSGLTQEHKLLGRLT